MAQTKGSFVQGYNAQIAVDSASQVNVAAGGTQETTESRQLLPILAQIEKNLEQKPAKASADAGYFSEANVTDAAVTGIDLYIATGRDKPADPTKMTVGDAATGATVQERMRHKILCSTAGPIATVVLPE